MTPLVSVITVCRNSAKTIGETLSSVGAQDYPQVEHILIDGASTDGTQAVISRQSSRVSSFSSEPDSGIYDAMNKGIARARGEIVCFLNADDRYASTRVLSMVVKQMTEENLGALYGDVAYYQSFAHTKPLRRYQSGRFTPERLAWGWMPAHPALFVTRSELARTGGFKVDYKIAGDFEHIVRLFSERSMKYEHLPEILVNMLAGGASNRGWRSKIILNQEVMRACRENGLKTNMFMVLSKYPAKLMELIV